MATTTRLKTSDASRRTRVVLARLLYGFCWLSLVCGNLAYSQPPPTPPAPSTSQTPSASPGEIGTSGEIPRLPDVNVEAPPPPAAPAPRAPQPPSPPTDDRFNMSPFTPPVTNGYSAPSAATGMLADTPVLSIPQSIGVVPRALLSDQQLFSVSEAFRNVSGVQTDFGAGNATDAGAQFSYLIRGFPTTYRRWNGYRSDLLQSSIDTGNIERIEFIKGPSSTLYGATDAGGFLNIITKKPQAADFTRVSFASGSWGLARTDVDVNRQVGPDVAYRVNVGLQQKDSFRNFLNDDRILVAPTVALRLTERTQLLLEGEYYSTNTMFDTGVTTLNGSFKTLPKGVSLNDPTDYAFGDYYKAGATLQHAISDAWHAQIGYSFGSSAQHTQSHFPVTRIGPQVLQIPVYQVVNGRVPTMLGSVAGTFETGSLVHHLASAFELQWLETATQTEFFFGAPHFLDPTNPVYAGTFPSTIAPGLRHSKLRGQIWSVQDRVELNDYFELVGGVSYQNFDRTMQAVDIQLPGASQDNIHAWTPRGSVLVHPVPGLLSGWYSYTESLLPQAFLFPDATGRAIAPTAGRQHEIGLRVAPGERWWASASVFDLTKTSVPIATPFNAITAANARSLGFEFDLYGALTERLNVTANYAYLDTKYTNDPIGAELQGRQVFLVPHNSANAWLRYNLIDDRAGRRGTRRVVGIGKGIRWVSSSETLNYRNSNPFGGANTLPGYVTADVGLFGEAGRLFANLYFENLKNVQYFTSGYGAFANPGNPLTVRATLGVSL